MTLEYTIQPIARWPGTRRRGDDQKFSPFRKTKQVQTSFGSSYRTSERGAPWSRIISDLHRELRHLSAENVVLRLDVEPRHIRADGQLRADARPASSALMLEFDAFGIEGTPRLIYKCDVFKDWQSNLYAIAKSLEALRLVDRYEVTTAGEQYAGFKALPATTEATLDTKGAANIIGSYSDISPYLILNNADDAKQAVRSAVHRTHPDRNNSDRTAYDFVERAKRVLVAHHGVAL